MGLGNNKGHCFQRRRRENCNSAQHRNREQCHTLYKVHSHLFSYSSMRQTGRVFPIICHIYIIHIHVRLREEITQAACTGVWPMA